jgi:PII-like signaling protein
VTCRPAYRLSIYLGNADTHRHRALSGEILRRAHGAGLAGATTLQGIVGFGHTGTMHATPRWGLIDRTPITVHIVDSPQNIARFLPELDDLADQCVVVCDRVDLLSTVADETADGDESDRG